MAESRPVNAKRMKRSSPLHPPANPRILVVDDEPGVVSLLKDYLQQHGFRVAGAANGRQALSVAAEFRPDLVVLDIMMPEMDGTAFLREYRKTSDSPVIMLTARVEETDRVVGLELGADDYVTKPFSPRELVARVRAVLRRSGGPCASSPILGVGDLILDRDSHQVRSGDRPINVTPTEFEILATLMTTPGRVFSRMELLESVQGFAYEGYERTIDVHIKNLRAKLRFGDRAPGYIETVYGVGYRLKWPE